MRATQFLSAAVVLKHLEIAQLGFHLPMRVANFSMCGWRSMDGKTTRRGVDRAGGYQREWLLLGLGNCGPRNRLSLGGTLLEFVTQPAVSTKVC